MINLFLYPPITSVLRKCFVVCAFVIVNCGVSVYAQVTSEQAMDFEVDSAWMTEPNLIDEFPVSALRCSSTGSFNDIAYGVQLSTEHVKSGTYSGKWARHNYFSTISTQYVPYDWTPYGAISFWIYSEVATDEEVVFAVQSDSNLTLWNDFFVTSFKVDWIGWKQIFISFSEFEKYESVVGWNKIDGIYFYTKAFNRQPNPYTVLYIDDMELVPTSKADLNSDQKIDFSDYAIFSNCWLMNLIAKEDFEAATLGDTLSNCGWSALYNANPDSWLIGISLDGGLAAVPSGLHPDSQFKKSIINAGIDDTDTTIVFEVDLVPQIAGGAKQNIKAGLFSDIVGFYPGLWVGFVPDAVSQDWKIEFHGSNYTYPSIYTSEYFITTNHLYRIKVLINQTGVVTETKASVYIRDITDNEDNYTSLDSIKDISLGCDYKSKPAVWNNWWIRGAWAGKIDNLEFTKGDCHIPGDKWQADFDNNKCIDFYDMVVIMEDWLN